MGNDGGSIPTRRELVKEAARNPTASELKESQHEQQEYYWTTDPISTKPLVQPVVSDSSGKLYNKDTILEYLVEGSHKDDADSITRGTVQSLKDIVEVKFELDNEASTKAKRDIFKCPVTGDKLGPGSKAAYLVPCGHAFSGAAIKEVSGEKCISCDTEYASNDIIPILPTAETDVARLSLRRKALKEKGLSHSLKKTSGGGKKRKKRDEVSEAAELVTTEADAVNGKATIPRTSTPINGSTDGNGISGINNSSTASIAAKIIQEQELSKKRKTESGNVRSLFSSRDQSKPIGKSSDFMTRGFSLPAETQR